MGIVARSAQRFTEPDARQIKLVMTAHARRRASQRHISPSHIQMVAERGRQWHGHGAVHYFFGRDEVARYRHLLGPVVSKLQDVVVVTSHDHCVLTVYHNPDAPKLLRRKAA